MKLSEKTQYKVDQKIKHKLYAIDLKYDALECKSKELLEKKKQRDINKAKRVATQRWENQERKLQWKKIKPKTTTNKQHKEKADHYFSRCIRWHWSWEIDWVWYNKCDTTWTILPIKELTVWHYKNRWVFTLRYVWENCTVQTAWQNQKEHYDDSNKALHKIAIIKKHWLDACNLLDSIEMLWVQKKNTKVDFEEEHNKWKDYYEKHHEHKYI